MGRAQQVHADLAAQADALIRTANDLGARLATRVERVSRWSVAEHLHHVAKAGTEMLRHVEEALATPGDSARLRPKFPVRVILWTNFIPRGVGKAPEDTLPLFASHADVCHGLERMRHAIDALRPRLGAVEACAARAVNPDTGALTPLEWLRFMRTHTHHHTKIIHAILAR
jgi:hypothetical protein